MRGTAQELPFEDSSFDLVISRVLSAEFAPKPLREILGGICEEVSERERRLR